MFGSANNRGKVENLRYATARSGTTDPSGDAKSHWLWADGSGSGKAGFNWSAVLPRSASQNRPRIQITTGRRNPDTKAELDMTPASDHANRYFWHCLLPGAAPNTVEFFDESYWAFPEARR